MLRLTLHRAILVVLTTVVVSALVPAGIVLYRRLAVALEDRARTDLERAPRILAVRSSALADAMMMHAKEFAHFPGVADAVGKRDTLALLKVGEQARISFADGIPVLVGSDGRTVFGPSPSEEMIAETRHGRMPVRLSIRSGQMHSIALAPIALGDRWIGAAGFASPVDESTAGLLAGLTRADVLIFANDSVTASSLDPSVATRLGRDLSSISADSTPSDLTSDGKRYIAVSAPLGDGARVVFLRSVESELSVLPVLRNIGLISGGAALLIALLLGAALSNRLARPARELATAAGDVARESFGAPLPTSRVVELQELAAAFGVMRRTLSDRLFELNAANTRLADRNARLTALQSELLQRDRLETTARLLSQLAHEIRNPVANVRNCLEIIRRRTDHDERTREFADLAIDELLRMHEMAEQMLDVNRPRDPAARDCSPLAVANDVARLATVGASPSQLSVDVDGSDTARASIAPDALKQVLTNLVQNAREAVAHEDVAALARVVISVRQSDHAVRMDVRDNGPGLTSDVRSRIFDAFFTTKESMRGVGLGLFVAQGLVRAAGGRIWADDASGPGARFCIELPIVGEAVSSNTAWQGGETLGGPE